MSGWKLWLALLGGAAALAVGVFAGAILARDTVDASPPGSTATTPQGGAPGSEPTTGLTSAGTVGTTGAPQDSACAIPPGEPFVGGPSIPMIELGEVNGLQVQGAIYPHPDYEGNPWTQWGQGIALSDGRFYSAIGDHLGVDGNSYVFEYDPARGELSMVGDLLSYVDHQPGSWGYGKVHGQMAAGSCGEIYFTSYWGTFNDLRFGGSYNGDLLFRIDPYARTIENLGVAVPMHGVPSLAASVEHHLVYGEAIDPASAAADADQGPFFVYDTESESVVFQGPAIPHVGYRNMIVDASGKAYYSIGGGRLAVYDPATNATEDLPGVMPADWLRASTYPSEDGWVYAVTDEPAVFFSLSPSGEIAEMGSARGYTTSMALDPDGSRFFYVPDAHGGAWVSGAPLVSVDTETGDETVLAELNPLVESTLGVRLGGTYSIAVSPSGDTLYIGMNVGALGSEDGFGEVALLIVNLP